MLLGDTLEFKAEEETNKNKKGIGAKGAKTQIYNFFSIFNVFSIGKLMAILFEANFRRQCFSGDKKGKSFSGFRQ